MKKIAISIAAFATLLATPVLAADMATKAPPVAPSVPTAAPWTGYYLGGNIGYAWGDDPTTTTGRFLLGAGGPLQPGSGTVRPDGGFLGIGSGYNLQLAPTWVASFETDFQYGRIKGTTQCIVACGTALPPVGSGYIQFTTTDRLDSFGTVRGRFGYLWNGSTLLYGTGGLAYGEVERIGLIVGRGPTGNGGPFGPFAGNYDDSSTRVGWTAGGGIETRLMQWSPNFAGWTAKVEYLYIDLGQVNDVLNMAYFSGNPGAYRNITSKIHENIIRFGMNYQFH